MARRKPNAVDQQIGARIRAARHSKGITQETLGAKLGLTFQQIQKYENGKNRIAASTLYDLATALEIPMYWFMPNHLKPPKAQPFYINVCCACYRVFDGKVGQKCPDCGCNKSTRSKVN